MDPSKQTFKRVYKIILQSRHILVRKLSERVEEDAGLKYIVGNLALMFDEVISILKSR